MHKRIFIPWLVLVTISAAVGCSTVDEAVPTSSPPRVIKQPAASYPMSALATCTTGYAVVRFRVDREGRVHDPEVTESQPSAVFNEAAITAVMASRFEPRANGSGPLDTTLTQKIDFAAPSNCIPFDTGEPGSDDFDEDAARNACFASGGNQWGFAELHFVVSPAGQASQVEVHRATDGDLSDKARAALAREQFEPRFAGQTLSRVLEFCSR